MSDDETVAITFTDEDGHVIAHMDLPRDQRTPQLKRGAEVFLATRCEGGQWFYRRVGKERA